MKNSFSLAYELILVSLTSKGIGLAFNYTGKHGVSTIECECNVCGFLLVPLILHIFSHEHLSSVYLELR